MKRMMRSMMKINIKNILAQIAVVVAIYALPLFIPGGFKAWPAAWIFLALWFGFWLAVLIWLFVKNPGLFNERMRLNASNQANWDRIIGPSFYALLFTWLLFISFDSVRFHWSPVPLWLQIIGAATLLCSFYLFFITFRENTYLSPVVRIQEERGQQVISSGPYHYVRHPMYAATVVFFVGVPLLLGSWYGIPLGIIPTLLLAWRAVLEETTLQRKLVGYSTYMAEVKYRLIPHIW